jgi:TonB family protein
MNSLLRYAIESSISLALLCIFFELVLGRDTRHRSNRYFLIGSMVLSLVIPLLNINLRGASGFMPDGGLLTALLPEVFISPSPGNAGQAAPADIAWLVYGAGIIVSVLFVISGLLYPVKLLFTSSGRGKIIVFNEGDHNCFSSLGHVFISSAISGPDAERMINHEMKHIKMGHHTDLILVTVITVIQWFNPAAHIMRRRLIALHEFEADNACISDGEDPALYSELLLSSVFRSHTSILSNNFSSNSLLKNRIIMMTKKRTGSGPSLKMILAIPVVSLLMLMFSCNDGSNARKDAAADGVPAAAQAETQAAVPEGATKSTSGEVFKVVEKMPAYLGDTTGKSLGSWLSANFKYPKEAIEKGIQGKVLVEFVIDEEGNVTDPHVIKSVDPILDKAALEMVAGFPKWEPGMQNGVPVKVSMTLPLSFSLK